MEAWVKVSPDNVNSTGLFAVMEWLRRQKDLPDIDRTALVESLAAVLTETSEGAIGQGAPAD